MWWDSPQSGDEGKAPQLASTNEQGGTDTVRPRPRRPGGRWFAGGGGGAGATQPSWMCSIGVVLWHLSCERGLQRVPLRVDNTRPWAWAPGLGADFAPAGWRVGSRPGAGAGAAVPPAHTAAQHPNIPNSRNANALHSCSAITHRKEESNGMQ
jgi:hypothetical protein